MEARMKYWIGALATGIAIVTVLALPAGSLFDSLVTPRERLHRPASERLRDLNREADRIGERLSVTRVLDSLTAVVESTEERFVLGMPEAQAAALEKESRPGDPRVTSPSFRAIFDWIGRNELRLATEPVRTGLFLVETKPYAEGRFGESGAQAFAGTGRDGTPYCLHVVMDPEGSFARHLVSREPRRPEEAALGMCRYWIRYGPPGRSVQRWLGDGGGLYATTDSSRYLRSELRAALAAPVGLARTQEGVARRWFLQAVAEACDRSDREDCPLLASVARRDRPVDETADGGPTFVGTSRLRYLVANFNAPLRGILFAELERIHGREAFRRFWTSEEPVELAFEEAFGKEMGPWVHDWTEELAGRRLAASRLRASATLLSLLVLTALVGVAVRTSRRREV